MVVTKGAALLALYDVAREFMSITSAKIDTREQRERDWESYRGVFTYFSQPKQGKHGKLGQPFLFTYWLTSTMGQFSFVLRNFGTMF